MVDAKIAARGWRDLPYPPSPYPHIDKCAEIAGKEIACLATSWGLFQILGENHKMFGFETALEAVTWLAASELNQFTAWVRVIESMGVKDDLLREDWHGYAKRYNGPKYASHGYHTKLAALAVKFAKKYGKGIPELPAPSDPVPTVPDIVTPAPLPIPSGELTLENLSEWPPETLLAGQVAALEFLRRTLALNQARLNSQTQINLTKAALSPPQIEEIDMSFINTKSPLKSKTILGIVATLVAMLVPASKPIVDMFMPDTANLSPEVIEHLVVAAKQTFESARLFVELAGLALAAYGRKTADTKI